MVHINWVWLVVIITLTANFGYMLGALMAIRSRADEEEERDSGA